MIIKPPGEPWLADRSGLDPWRTSVLVQTARGDTRPPPDGSSERHLEGAHIGVCQGATTPFSGNSLLFRVPGFRCFVLILPADGVVCVLCARAFLGIDLIYCWRLRSDRQQLCSCTHQDLGTGPRRPFPDPTGVWPARKAISSVPCPRDAGLRPGAQRAVLKACDCSPRRRSS